MSSSRDVFGFVSPCLPPAGGAGVMQAKAFKVAGATLTRGDTVERTDIIKARRQGLALEARADGWSWLSAADKKRAASPLAFHQLAACCDRVPEETLYAIEEDCRTIFHTFKQNPLFASSKGVNALSRLLMAFAQRNPNTGYVRSHTARLAALVLVVYGVRDVEGAFWSFCALAEDRMFNCCDSQIAVGSMVCGAMVEQRVLERLVAKKLPVIADHLAKLRLPLATLTHGWFSSCFVSVLPAETAVRVIDSVMAEGSKVLQRVALALLRRHEAAIVSCSRGDCLRKVIEARISRATDVDELMQMAFGGIGSLPGSLLKTYRDPESRLVAAEMAQANANYEVYSLSRVISSSVSLNSRRSASSSGRSE